MRAPLAIFALVLLISADLSARSLPDPDNYDQCVRESMKGVTSDSALDLTARVCREKFLGTKSNNIELAPEILDKLIIHAGFGYGIFSGSIYNGNSDYTITQVTILLAPMRKKEFAEAFGEGKKYNINLTLQPFAKGALSMPIPSDNTLEYSWKLVKTRGYKAQ